MSGPGRNPRIATESITGRRSHQEDGVRTADLADGRTLVAVADGMGGHAAGEVASELALESLVETLRSADYLDAGEALEAAVQRANERVYEVAKEPDKQGMGTTLVAMLVDGDHYWIANVGDSRGYALVEGGIDQITRDHSFVAEAVERGTPIEKARASPWKDALTRSIGTEPEVEVDIYGPRVVYENTAVLLCSDGLYKALSRAEIGSVFRRSGGPEGAAQALVSAALDGGSDDNITVAIVEFGEVPRERAGGTLEMEWEPPEEADVPPATASTTSSGAVSATDLPSSGEGGGSPAGTGRSGSPTPPDGSGTGPGKGRRLVGALVLAVVIALVAIAILVLMR